MATENAEQFPSFEQSGFYKSWLEALLIFPDQTPEQRSQGWQLAYEIWLRTKQRWEADQRKSRDDGIGLVS
jgi:hypothetical protein